MNKTNKKQQDDEKEVYKKRRKVARLYKEGYCLGELCREVNLDISSILYLLRKSKIKKKKLYTIYEIQEERIADNKDILLEKELHFIEKYFPLKESTSLNGGYYWHWKDKFKAAQEKKEKCNHDVRHVRCASCNMILRDASNIPLDDVITRQLTNEERLAL